MRYLKTSLTVATAAILAVGCDQERRAGNERALEGSKDAVQKSVREAKSEVDKQAKAQKDILEAEARSAQAKLDAEKARVRAESTDAQGKVDAAAQNIRDAAGAASDRSARDTGTGRAVTAPPSEATPVTPPPPVPTTPSTTPTPTPTPQPTTSNAESDQKLTEQVRSAVVGGGDDNAGAKTIQVSVSGGTATLTGSVASDTEKAQAEQKAKAVSGVTKVDNQLQVKQ
jgi:hypothetical protein